MFTAQILRFFHPVLEARALGRGPRKVVVAGQSYVIFRDASGAAAALEDRCPHRFSPLSTGRVRKDGRLECPYHGWHFDAQGHGCSPTQPDLTRCDVRSLQVVERYGYIWIASRETPLSSFPSMEYEGFELAGVYDTLFEAPLHVALDNFSEDEHTPWVHHRLGWDQAHVSGVKFENQVFDDRTEVAYSAPQRFGWMGAFLLLQPSDTFHNEWITRFDPVRTIYDIFWTSRRGKRRTLDVRGVVFFIPETEMTTRFHVFTWVRLRVPMLRPLMPMLRRSALWLGWAEINDDRKFVSTLAETPFELKGMRLGKFDKPIVHNHKLLRKIYIGEEEGSALRAVPQ